MLAQRIVLEPHDTMLIAGFGVFLILSVALQIFDAIRNLGYWKFALLSSVLLFLFFFFGMIIVAPTQEPLLPTLGSIAFLSIFSAFASAAVYFVQKKYIIAARNAENPEVSKREPGQYY